MDEIEDSPDSLYSMYFMMGVFPVWSVVSQVVAALVLVGAQTLLHRATPRYFDVLNEFICCFAWVWWTLETVLLGYMRSSTVGMLSLFVRLLIYPFISDGAPNNPCSALYLYLTAERRSFSRFCVSVVIELCAMVLALLYCNVYWNLLGVTVSSDHFVFLEAELDYFLKTSPHYGFLNELMLSFLMFVPSLFMKPSFFCSLVESVFVIFLILQFNTFTGAFMNPMSALACSLYWHSLGTDDYLIHIVVFWVGPFIGTWAATRLHTLLRDTDKPKLV